MPGEYSFEVIAPKITLFPATYTLTCWSMIDGAGISDDCVVEAMNIVILEDDITGNFAKFNIANTFSAYDNNGHASYTKSEWRML